MKKIIRSAAVIAAAAALVCASGCSGDTSWAFSSGDNRIKNGNWIFCTYDGTMEAVQELQKENSENTITSIDFDKQLIDGKPAKDWIYLQAKIACKRQLTLDNLMKKYGAVVDTQDVEYMKNLYVSYVYNGNKELFEKLGVSEDSFVEAYVMPQYKADAVFKKLYGKDGEKAVPDDEVTKYFTDNYVTFYSLSYSLKTTTENGTTELDDETKEKVDTNFKKYQHMLNDQGKTTKEVDDQYKIDFEVENSPSESETTVLDEIEDENLKKAVTEAEVGKAYLTTVNDTMYLVYKTDINEKAKSIKYSEDITEEDSGAVSREGIVSKMKKDEFEEYLDQEIDKLDYTRNDPCIYKYSVMRTVGMIRDEASKNQ